MSEDDIDYERGDRAAWDQAEASDRNRARRHAFEYLCARGLAPHHKLLDVGCGWLRVGVLFIEYLEPGNYYGFDKEASHLRAGFGGLDKYGLRDKAPTILLERELDLSRFDLQFDFALAQSVFTHMSRAKIETCLRNVAEKLVPGGRLFASFYPWGSVYESGPHPARADEILDARQPLSFYEQICEQLGLELEYIPDWGHPFGQNLLILTRRG